MQDVAVMSDSHSDRRPTIITCAVTGGDDSVPRHPQVPVTPRQIADAAIDAARAGAAIVHIHVRDPHTGKASMDVDLYREVVDRIRGSDTDVLINLTTGPGARFVPSLDQHNVAAAGSNVRPPMDRVRHISALKPDICSLDMGTLNFGHGALINTPAQIAMMAAEIQKAGVRPELEIFEPGHLALASEMIAEGKVAANSFLQFALGISWGAPATAQMMSYYMGAMPRGMAWSAFGVGRSAFPTVAQACLMGGHTRVGLEDNFYLSKGIEAKANAQLVEKAVAIIRALGGEPATPAQARMLLALPG